MTLERGGSPGRWLTSKHVIIGGYMEITPEKERRYYEVMLNALAGIEGDLIANDVPEEAIEYVRNAILICNSDFKRRFRED